MSIGTSSHWERRDQSFACPGAGVEERLDGRCVVGRHSGRWAILGGQSVASHGTQG